DDRASKTAMEEMLNKLLKEKDKKPKTQVDIAADRKTALEDLRRRVDEGEKPAQLGNLIQRLARGFGGEGVRDRERLIDLVHGVVQGIIPDWERRQTIDAISGYGDFKQLSKDQISVVLRGMKGEMQQLAKLEDMAAGQPPLKSGVERRTPTEAERELIKRVNKAKFEFQIPVKDPATQLQSALDTMKKTLRTRIADYERRLKEGDFAPRVRRELKLDTTAVRLKAEAQKAKEAFQKGLVADRLKNRNFYEKVRDAFVKWRQLEVLSGPRTLAKLVAAAASRTALTPVEEAAGGLISK